MQPETEPNLTSPKRLRSTLRGQRRAPQTAAEAKPPRAAGARLAAFPRVVSGKAPLVWMSVACRDRVLGALAHGDEGRGGAQDVGSECHAALLGVLGERGRPLRMRTISCTSLPQPCPSRDPGFRKGLFALILLLKLNKQFPVEQLEATVSQSTVPSPPLKAVAAQGAATFLVPANRPTLRPTPAARTGKLRVSTRADSHF